MKKRKRHSLNGFDEFYWRLRRNLKSTSFSEVLKLKLKIQKVCTHRSSAYTGYPIVLIASGPRTSEDFKSKWCEQRIDKV